MNSSAKSSPPKITTKTKPNSAGNILTPQLTSNMGKQIVQNMESVIKSLKKRKKHKKHKQKMAIKAMEEETVDSEDESLAKIKENWISTRPKKGTTIDISKNNMDSPSTENNSTKKNAFQMLMLNGKAKDDTPTQDESHKKASPGVGKRTTSGLKTQNSAKRKKMKNTPGEIDGSPGGTLIRTHLLIDDNNSP